LNLGLKLTQIHSIIRFQQSDFIRPYIELNTKLRQQAQNRFKSDFHKLMCNAIYGKACQSIRKYQNITLCTTWEQARKKINSPSFKSATIFTEDLTAIHWYKKEIFFNKPMYIGFSVLEYAKYLMYEFHYKVVKPYFKNNITLLYTDTDSFIYEIHNQSVEEFMLSNADYFDTSDYPKDHPCYSPVNKKVIGKFKDELQSQKMLKFIGLRSKMYAFVTESDFHTRLKGIKRVVLEKSIRFEDYWECLVNHVECFRDQNVIRSYKHNIVTETVTKKALSWNDDKRHLIPNSVETLAHGHYSIVP
jgi:hypothetical protein